MRYVHFDPSRVKRRGKGPWLKPAKPCLWCGATLAPEERTWEHLRPLALGGSRKHKNLAVACSPCNFDRAKVTGACLNQLRLSLAVETTSSMTVAELVQLIAALHRLRQRICRERDHYAKWVAIEIRVLGHSPSAACAPLSEQATEGLLARAHAALALRRQITE